MDKIGSRIGGLILSLAPLLPIAAMQHEEECDMNSPDQEDARRELS